MLNGGETTGPKRIWRKTKVLLKTYMLCVSSSGISVRNHALRTWWAGITTQMETILQCHSISYFNNLLMDIGIDFTCVRNASPLRELYNAPRTFMLFPITLSLPFKEKFIKLAQALEVNLSPKIWQFIPMIWAYCTRWCKVMMYTGNKGSKISEVHNPRRALSEVLCEKGTQFW